MGPAEKLRPVSLKIAGVPGMVVAVFYLAVAVSEEGGVGPALLWLVPMATAALLAWFADQFRGRRAAVVLCLIGFVDFSPK